MIERENGVLARRLGGVLESKAGDRRLGLVLWESCSFFAGLLFGCDYYRSLGLNREEV